MLYAKPVKSLTGQTMVLGSDAFIKVCRDLKVFPVSSLPTNLNAGCCIGGVFVEGCRFLLHEAPKAR